MNQHSLGLRIVTVLVVTGVSFLASPLAASANDDDADARSGLSHLMFSQHHTPTSMTAADAAYAEAMHEHLSDRA